MNYLDLFSGVGGFHYGLEQAGFEFEWAGFCEIDKYAKQIYQGHFPDSEDLGDVRTIRLDRLPKIDIVTFGFPCQDLSVAGKRAGLSGERSGLFFEAMRIIKTTKPDVFIFENVKGLLSSGEGRDFAEVLRTIADLGLYECEWQLLNTAEFLPHNRERVFFVGHLAGRSRPKVFPITQEDRGDADQNGLSSSHRGLLRPLWTLSMSEESRRAILRNRRLRYFTEVEYARLQGFPDDWFENYSWAVAHKCAGNAVSVPVIKAIGERLRRGSVFRNYP